jgi:hypothetical protein
MTCFVHSISAKNHNRPIRMCSFFHLGTHRACKSSVFAQMAQRREMLIGRHWGRQEMSRPYLGGLDHRVRGRDGHVGSTDLQTLHKRGQVFDWLVCVFVVTCEVLLKRDAAGGGDCGGPAAPALRVILASGRGVQPFECAGRRRKTGGASCHCECFVALMPAPLASALRQPPLSLGARGSAHTAMVVQIAT